MRYRWIIARDDRQLYEYLKNHFAGRPNVEVILDRRHGERRQRSASSPVERRRAERRRHSVEADLAALGVAIVTVP